MQESKILPFLLVQVLCYVTEPSHLNSAWMYLRPAQTVKINLFSILSETK